VAELIDPTAEDAYWREQHRTQPYATHREYDEFAGAYRAGYEGYGRHYKEGTRFEDVETDLRSDYESRLAAQESAAAVQRPVPWDEARPAARAAWDRVHQNYGTRRDRQPDV
jgi:hypothetical protein